MLEAIINASRRRNVGGRLERHGAQRGRESEPSVAPLRGKAMALDGVGESPLGQRLVLVIGAEARRRFELGQVLRRSGYATLEASTTQQGLSQALHHVPDLVLIDFSRSDSDPIKLTRTLGRCQLAPVFAMIDHNLEEDCIQALDAGAVDCVQSSLSRDLLLARIRSALRRRGVAAPPAQVFFNGLLHVSVVKQEVRIDGSAIRLTPKEFRLFSLLVRRAGEVVPYRELVSELWDRAQVRDVQHLRIFMKQLRDKLEVHPAIPRFLLTAPGVGYTFEPEPEYEETPALE